MGWPCPIPSHASRVCWCALALLTLPACGPHKVACDAADHAAQEDLAADAAACVRTINACETVECVDAAEAACHKKGDARCRP